MVDRSSQVNAVANTLRLVQNEVADASPATRSEHLSRELKQELDSLAHPERLAFLEDLLGRFPVWDEDAKTTPPANAPAASDVDTLLTAIAERCQKFDEPRKRQILDELQRKLNLP